jgi:phytoene dehydrogenase-like protein
VAIVTEAMRRGAGSERCDVAVVGAGLPGLVAASILARRGARVVLLDAARRPGGRLQTIAHQGFAIDVSPPLWESAGLRDALAAAGVASPPLAPVVARRDVFAAVLEGGAVRGGAHPLPVPGAVPSPMALEAVEALFGASPRTWARLGEACAALVEQDGDGAPGPAGRLGEWAASGKIEPSLVPGLFRCAALLGAFDPVRSDVRRLAHRLRWLSSGEESHVVPAEHAWAGARGVIESLVDAAVEAGVETRLGTRVLSLEIERGRLRGLLVQREELPFLATLGAERVVLAVPPAEARRLLPANLRPPPAPGADSMLGLAFGLRRVPWPDGLPPPPALRLLGPATRGAAASPGTPVAPILLSSPQGLAPSVAPPGQGLLLAHAPVPGDRIEAGEMRRLALLARSAILDLHPGAEIAWEHAWFRPAEMADPLVEPSDPVDLPALPGLRFAGWGIGLSHCVTHGPAAAAATAVAAAEASSV